jgi:hypothetical protein
MKFGNFKLGKKDKTAAEDQIAAEDPGVPIDEIVLGAEPVQPHAPLQELSLDADAEAAAAEGMAAQDAAAPAEEEGEPIKLVEVKPVVAAASAAPAPPPPPPPPLDLKKDAPKKNDPMDLSASISNIFTDADDEDNPLINLIRSLPEVAATELIDDLKEINDIIKDWQKK